MATTAPESPHWREDRVAWKRELDAWCAAIDFRGLQVFRASEDGERGQVAFYATLFHGEREVSFGETSNFVRLNGRWWYVDGEPFQPDGQAG